MPAANSQKAADQGLGKPTNRYIAKDCRPFLTYPSAWKAEPSEGCIAKEAPFWAFLNLGKA